MHSSKPIIEVKNLSKRYRLGTIGARSFRDAVDNGWQRLKSRFQSRVSQDSQRAGHPNDFWALRDVSFDIAAGSVVGVVGRNGAGKSTLLKILSRITEPTHGEAVLRGRVASLLEVGTGFHPELTGRDNVYLNGAILGLKHAEIAARFDEIVAFSAIEKFIDTPVKRYSSGMYVRLAFAVAAHLEPEILIVDEVLAVGDQAFQQKCLGKMQDVAANSGRTVLFVSHQMSSVRRLCQHCLVMSNGTSSALLPVDEAVTQYNTLYRESASNFRVDTSNFHRDETKGKVVRILQVEAVGESPLLYGERMLVVVTIEVRNPVTGLMVGLAFESLEGARTMTVDSDSGGHLLDLGTGTYQVRLELPSLPLHPAQYVVHVVAGSGKYYFDTIHRCAVWEVMTSAHDRVSDRGFGGCRVVPEVTHSLAA